MKDSESYTEEMYVNITITHRAKEAKRFDVMTILQIIIATVGINANFTVILAFLNHKQLRKKVPNMFIINQVRYFDLTLFLVNRMNRVIAESD